MDVLVGAVAATATVSMGVTVVTVSILAMPAVARLLSLVAAPTSARSLGRSSLTAIPNPFFSGGASLANAA